MSRTGSTFAIGREHRPRSLARRAGLVGAVGLLGLASCDGGLTTGGSDGSSGSGFVDCDLNPKFLWASLGRDAVRTLDEPVWVQADESTPDYLDPDSRVIGIVTPLGQAFAVPHGPLWQHEVVNFEPEGSRGPALAVTYCPLTGSSLVFDRKSIDRATLGISGVLFMNNLVLFDRRGTQQTLWPQMMAQARCGPGLGQVLDQSPFVELEWREWVRLHPSTLVLAGPVEQGFDPNIFDYSRFGYPYGNYRDIPQFWIDGLMPPIDPRRFPKERVVGLPSADGEPGIALPFGALSDLPGSFQAVEVPYRNEEAVVLWSDAARGGMAFWSRTLGGDRVRLRPAPNGFEDEATGSTWTVDGRAVSGPLAGARLEPIERAYTAFWGAWAAFHPETRLWEG